MRSTRRARFASTCRATAARRKSWPAGSGVDRSTVSNLIRLLELPDEVLDAVRANEITQGHARALLGLPDAESQLAACRRIIAEHLSVRQTEALVTCGAPTPSRPRVRKDAAHAHDARPPHLLDLEQLGSTSAWARPS